MKSKKQTANRSRLSVNYSGIGIVAWTFFILLISSFTALSVPISYNRYLMDSVGSKVLKVTSLDQRGGGTGFLINTPIGVKILTNAHVCSLAYKGRMLGHMANGYTAELKIYQLEKSGVDLCLLDAPEGYDGLNLGSVPSNGSYLISIGHPLLDVLQETQGVLLSRVKIVIEDFIVGSDLDKCKGFERFLSNKLTDTKLHCYIYQESYNTTLKVKPGASGSPVVNLYGNVIGVVFAYDALSEHGFVIPYQQIKNFLDSI